MFVNEPEFSDKFLNALDHPKSFSEDFFAGNYTGFADCWWITEEKDGATHYCLHGFVKWTYEERNFGMKKTQ